MVSYSIGASILLAVHGTIVNAKTSSTNKRLRPSTDKKNVASNGRTGPSKNARTLYSSEHGMDMKVDTDKKCWDEVLGTPKVCVHICVSTTSNWIDGNLMNEYTSKPTESKCKDGWDGDHSYSKDSGDGWHGYTEWPTYSPVSHDRSSSWSGDGHDGWKCEEKPHKPSWSSPSYKSLHSIDNEWSSHSTDHDRSWYSSSSGKSGKSGSSDWGSGKSGKSGSHSGDWGSGKSGKSGGYASYDHSGYDDWVSSSDTKLEWYSASDGKSGKSNSHRRQLRMGTLKKVHGEWGEHSSSSSDDDWHSGSGGKSGKSGSYHDDDDDWAGSGGKSGKSGSGGGGSWGKSGKSGAGSGSWKSSGKKPSSSWKAITSIDKWTASPTICDTPTPTVVTSEPSLAPTTCEGRPDYKEWYWLPFGNTCENGPDQGGRVPRGPSFSSGGDCCACITAILNKQDNVGELCPSGFNPDNTPNNLGPGKIIDCRPQDFCNPTQRPTHSPTSSPTSSPTGNPTPPANIVQTPQPSTCLEREWFFDGQICTNGFLDSSNDGGILFNTLKDCCEDVFPQGTCEFNDICFTDSPTPSPTYSSTNGSTPTVSKETTGPPTTAIVPRRGTGAHQVSH